MLKVGERVYHGNGCELRDPDEIFVAVEPAYERIVICVEDTYCVTEAFAPAKLEVGVAKVFGEPAQLEDAILERDHGARGRFLEIECHGHPCEVFFLLAAGVSELQVRSHAKQRLHLFLTQIGDRKKVPAVQCVLEPRVFALHERAVLYCGIYMFNSEKLP